jgi:hypothetical protein
MGESTIVLQKDGVALADRPGLSRNEAQKGRKAGGLAP